jgi:hypothetical protein
MKYNKRDEDSIELARNIIKDVLPLTYLDKIYRKVKISCEVAFVDDTGNQHMAKRYANNANTINLILMYWHFMPNVIIDKSIVICCISGTMLYFDISYFYAH